MYLPLALSPSRPAVSWMVAAMLAAPPEGPARPRHEAPVPPPGGYWSLGERREPEPDDGQTHLTVGGILLGLGAVRAGSGALGVALTADLERCRDVYGNVPANTCRGLEVYGWVGVGAGALMVVTGSVFLGLGAAAKRRHEAWRLRNSVAFSSVDGVVAGGAWRRGGPVAHRGRRGPAPMTSIRPAERRLRWRVAPWAGPRGSGVVAELRF
jgi:hypothetical protein